MVRAALTISAAVLALCAAWTSSAQTGSLTEAESREIDQQIERGGDDTDAAMYARDVGVSLTEAKRRMAIQNRDAVRPREEPGPPPPPPDSVSRIGQLLEQKEAASFAGMWWQHQPDYRMVVAFTRDPEATLRKYTTDPLFEARLRPGPSQAELRATQDRVFKEVVALGIGASGGSDIKEGRVELAIHNDWDKLQAALADGRLRVPAYVRFTPPPTLRRAPPAPPPGVAVPFLPRSKSYGGPSMTALAMGRLEVVDGCVRLMVGSGRGTLVIWDGSYALDAATEPGVFRIVNRRSGDFVRVGDEVALGGGGGSKPDPAWLLEPIPEGCRGPYFYGGGTTTRAEWDAERLPHEAKELAARERISLAETTRKVEAVRLRDRRLRELALELEREAPDTFAGMHVWDGQARALFTRDPEGELARLVPSDLRPHVKAELGARALAPLNAAEAHLLGALDRLGLEANVGVNMDAGRLEVSTDELVALDRAAADGRIFFPEDVQIVTSGAGPAGQLSEANTEAELRRAEASPDFAAVHKLVAATRLPSRLVNYEENGPEATLGRAAALETAQWLASHGWTAERIRGARAGGFDPVRALRARTGMDTVEGRALLTDQVILGEVLSVDPNGVGLRDGARSTARFRVVETLKGDLAPGVVAAVRLDSGFENGPELPRRSGGAAPAGRRLVQANGEPMVLPNLPGSLRPGTRWLLFLSESGHARTARLTGGRPAAGERWFRADREMAPVQGDMVGRTYTEPALGGLSTLRARLAPVQAATR